MKGISPLIASVLLIAFTVALATLIFGFMTTTTRSATDKIENKTTEAIDCSSASINIEDVFISGLSTVRVIVKNTGFTDGLTIKDLQVYNTTGSNFTSGQVPLTGFDRGRITTFTVNNANFTSCPSAFSRVLVTTSCGGVADAFTGTPKCS